MSKLKNLIDQIQTSGIKIHATQNWTNEADGAIYLQDGWHVQFDLYYNFTLWHEAGDQFNMYMDCDTPEKIIAKIKSSS